MDTVEFDCFRRSQGVACCVWSCASSGDNSGRVGTDFSCPQFAPRLSPSYPPIWSSCAQCGWICGQPGDKWWFSGEILGTGCEQPDESADQRVDRTNWRMVWTPCWSEGCPHPCAFLWIILWTTLGMTCGEPVEHDGVPHQPRRSKPRSSGLNTTSAQYCCLL